MPCDSRPFRKNQTLTQRKTEVQTAVQKLGQLLTSRGVTAKVSPQGAIAFAGWTEQDRQGITDACAYRRIMATGSVTAKLAIARAEQLAGRSVSRQTIANGVHSHDGGKSWHNGH